MLVDKDKPFYSITQVAELLDMSTDRLRSYDEENLVCPERRKNDNKRLYSEFDIEWLKDLRTVIAKKRMNIYSFKLIIKLLNEIPDKKLEQILNNDSSDNTGKILIQMKKNPNFKKIIFSKTK